MTTIIYKMTLIDNKTFDVRPIRISNKDKADIPEGEYHYDNLRDELSTYFYNKSDEDKFKEILLEGAMMKKIKDTLHQVHHDLTTQGYKVYAVVLKGSQNYNLHDHESDIDLTAIIIPTLRDIINHKTISKKIIYPFGEVVIHDIIHFNNILYKGNPGYIEMVHSRYKLGDLSIFKSYKINPKALLGMALEKQKALTHRYPSREHMVDKFGYDPKQLHHIIRLADICDKLAYDENHTYVIYDGDDVAELLKIKRGDPTIDTDMAKYLSEDFIKDIRFIINRPPLSNWQQIDKVDILPLIESYLIQEYKERSNESNN